MKKLSPKQQEVLTKLKGTVLHVYMPSRGAGVRCFISGSMETVRFDTFASLVKAEVIKNTKPNSWSYWEGVWVLVEVEK